MKRINDFLKNACASWGIDKWAHLGIGSCICAFFTIILAMQDGATGWQWPLYTATGWAVTFLFGFVKEYGIDDKADWWDILATMLGPAIVTLSTVFGAVLYTLSN